MTVDTSYAGAIALVLVGVLNAFGIVVQQDVVVGLVTGVIALVIAIHTKTSKNLTVAGTHKI